jgi:hypothetical protein
MVAVVQLEFRNLWPSASCVIDCLAEHCRPVLKWEQAGFPCPRSACPDAGCQPVLTSDRNRRACYYFPVDATRRPHRIAQILQRMMEGAAGGRLMPTGVCAKAGGGPECSGWWSVMRSCAPTRRRIGGGTGVICQSSCYHEERNGCCCLTAATVPGATKPRSNPLTCRAPSLVSSPSSAGVPSIDDLQTNKLARTRHNGRPDTRINPPKKICIATGARTDPSQTVAVMLPGDYRREEHVVVGRSSGARRVTGTTALLL